MNGINDFLTPHKSIIFRFGNKGSLAVQSWMTEKISKDRRLGASKCVNLRILRAYFQKRAHSIFVASLLKGFRIESLREESKAHIPGTLTLYPPFQTPPGKDLSNGSS